MPSIVHLANTQVEFEYAQAGRRDLADSLSRHPLCLQLQFLPLLYAAPDDLIAVTALPPNDYLARLAAMLERSPLARLVPLAETLPFQGRHCLSWGHSREVGAWAAARRMTYSSPSDWDLVCLVNSKAFSSRYSPLKHSACLQNASDLRRWIEGTMGPKVLKTCFGVSANGHRRINNQETSPELLAFCGREWQAGRGVIAEPWLERITDFSTQWFLSPQKSLAFIGATRFETNAQGVYQATWAGAPERLFSGIQPFLQQHLEFVQRPLQDIAEMGFFGFLGIDAFLYRDATTQQVCLQPLVEINGRQTMSLAALRLQQRLCPDKILRLYLQGKGDPANTLLPSRLTQANGSEMIFKKTLNYTVYP